MNNLYKACDFYMIRTPMLPIEFYKKNCIDYIQQGDENLKNNIFRESIQIGSLSLYNSIDNVNQKVSRSLLKYMIRMSTRTTPYGLFSGVNVGAFSDYTNIELDDISKYKKRLRPDMQWVYGLINKITSDYNNLPNIKVRSNNIIYKKGDRLENPYVTNLGLCDIKGDDLVSSIRYTSLLDLVLKNTENFIEIKSLVEIVKTHLEVTDEIKIYDYLLNLINLDYLLIDLLPPQIDTDALEYIVFKLEKINKHSQLYLDIKNIHIKINNYNSLYIGEGSNEILDIIDLMKSIYETKNYIQVDFLVSTKNNTLNKSIPTQIEEYCNFLKSLGLKNQENIALKTYKDEFLERYGYDMEVQLLELLDDDIGLGSPAGYLTPLSNRKYEQEMPNEKAKKIKKLFEYKIIEANFNKENTIRVVDEDFEDIINNYEKLDDIEMAPSVEFNVFVSAQNSLSVDNGNYELFIGPNFGSHKAGKTFGRFMDILDDEKKLEINNTIYNKELDILSSEDYIMVELVEVLQNGRGNNITINSNGVDYQLCIATNSSKNKSVIDIKDLYIGVNDNKFYIKSKSLNKKIYITYHHMMLYLNGCNLGRFLKEITASYYMNIMDIALTLQFNEFDYVPRIMYKNIVISPRTWKLKKIDLYTSLFKEFKSNFKKFIYENNIPRYIYQKENDNRLILDIESNTHIQELYNYLKKSDKFIILTETEYGDNLDKSIVKSDLGETFCCEIVIPLIRDKVSSINKYEKLNIVSLRSKSNVEKNKKYNYIGLQDKSRNIIWGNNNWYYYKLYVSKLRINEIIGDYIFDFCEDLIKDNIIEKYFFIRYSDPDVHIRLRFKSYDNQELNLLSKLKVFFEVLYNKGLINIVQSDNYVRELERYGGFDVIDTAESYFFSDSRYVGNLISLMRKKKISYTEDEIAMISIALIMKNFGLNLDEQDLMLSEVIDKNEFRDIYKSNRKEFMKIIDLHKFEYSEDFKYLKVFMEARSNYTQRYKGDIDRIDNLGLLQNYKGSILLSIIHMFCNRFSGNSEWERKIMALVRHSIHDLNALQKSLSKVKS